MSVSKRGLSFALLLGVLACLVAGTFLSLLDKVRFGLEFRGGDEIYYLVNPAPGKAELTQSDLLQTVDTLRQRAGSIGISEPGIRLEGTNHIRVKPAGLSSVEESRSLLVIVAGSLYHRAHGLNLDIDVTADTARGIDVEAFQAIVADTQTLLDAGDSKGARARITDLETAWDNPEERLRPINGEVWRSIDKSLDRVLKQVRTASPDLLAGTEVVKTLTAIFASQGAR